MVCLRACSRHCQQRMYHGEDRQTWLGKVPSAHGVMNGSACHARVLHDGLFSSTAVAPCKACLQQSSINGCGLPRSKTAQHPACGHIYSMQAQHADAVLLLPS